MTQDQWPAGKHYVETANLPAVFFANVDAGGDRDLLVSKVDGEWRSISWRRVADQVVFMDEGRIVEKAPPAEFFDRPQTERGQLFLSQILAH